MTKCKKNLPFEDRLAELESTVAKLEEGDLSLEESLALFEEGIRLGRKLQADLQAASLKVSRLLEDGSLKDLEGEPPDAQEGGQE